MPKAVAGTPSGRKTHGKNAPEASADSVVITSSNSDVQTSDIDKALNSLQDQLQRVDELCIPSETKAQELVGLLKSIFDVSTSICDKKFGAFEELYVDGADAETLWEELQSRNRPQKRYFKSQSKRLLKKLVYDREDAGDYVGDDEEEGEDGGEADLEIEGDQESDVGSDEEEDGDVPETTEDDDEDDASAEDEEKADRDMEVDDDSEDGSIVEEGRQAGKTIASRSGIEADVDAMESWLDDFEAMEERHRDKEERREARARGEKGHKGAVEEEDEEDDFDFVSNTLYDIDSDSDAEEVEEDDERASGKKDRRLGEGKGRNGRPAAAGALSQWKSKKTGNSKDGVDAKYEDFFGPREPSQVARKSAQKKPSGKHTRSLKGARFPDASGDFDNHEDDEESGSGGDFKGEDDFDRMLEERDMSGSDDAEGDDYGHSDDEDDDDEHIEEEEGEGEGSSVGQEDAKASKALSRHQQRQARLAEQVRQLEAEAVGEKSWELKGEVRAVDRPENSLLSVTMEVERASKPVPVITQDYTNTLEEMILKRVKEGKYDDVVPREMKSRTEVKPDFMLSQEKSDKGLGDIYADEFMRQTMKGGGSAAARDAENRQKEELRGLFDKVCRQLDALSHFSFTPKPMVADVSIKSTTPAISLEDIGPTSEATKFISSAAPEELHEHKRGRDAAFLADEEQTRDDKKRLRRASKSVRRKERQRDAAEEKLVAKLNPGMGNKYEAKKAMEKIRGDKRVVDASYMRQESDDAVKSFTKSSKFFSNLQRQTEEDVLKRRAGIQGSASKTAEGSAGAGARSAVVKL